MPDNLARSSIAEPKREEKINGQICLMSPAGTNHNTIAVNIWTIFNNYLQGRKCRVLPDNNTLFLPDGDYFVPDLMVICDPKIIYTDGVEGTPDLVVEVLSPTTEFKDRGDKKDTYEVLGVKEYWIVDPRNRTIEQYLLQDGRFRLAAIHPQYPQETIDDLPDEQQLTAPSFKTSLFNDLEISLDQVFQQMVSNRRPRKSSKS